MKGYLGKVLFVDLTTKEIHSETVPDVIYEQLLSGVGLGAYVLYKHIPTGANPLGPENMMGFVSGLLTGTPSLMTGRWMVVFKSPLTGGWGDTNCGGSFSPAIKQCGYDGIFISGVSAEPVYLYVDHKHAEIRSASHVWGVDAIEAEKILKNECDKVKKTSVAVIGTAGENLSLISGIVNEGGRIAARSGGGAVMGSKNLKAIVLGGTRPINCENPSGMKAISQELSGKMKKQNAPSFMKGWILPILGTLMGKAKKASPMDGMISAMMMKKWGTSVNSTMGVVNGDSPFKNWAGSAIDFNSSYYKGINPDQILKREKYKYHCYSCSMGCGGLVNIDDLGKKEFDHTHKPEYETIGAFGALLMNKDMKSILYINEMLNRAGLDTISAGGSVAFAIECFEKGLLTLEKTGGLELRWGNVQAIIELVKKMINREGIGDLFADGVKVAASRLNLSTAEFAVHVGGQEPPMHDPRLDTQLGIHYSVDPTPGRHTIGSATYYDTLHLWEKVSWAPNPGTYEKAEEYIPSEKLALKTVASSCYKELTDGAGGCLFGMTLGINHWKLFEWLNAATGWEKSPDEYMEIGKRIQTLRQMFNIKQGIDPWQFKLVSRMQGTPPLQAGPLKGRSVLIEDMMRLHWKNYGWDENTGVPTAETISELELDSILA